MAETNLIRSIGAGPSQGSTSAPPAYKSRVNYAPNSGPPQPVFFLPQLPPNAINLPSFSPQPDLAKLPSSLEIKYLNMFTNLTTAVNSARLAKQATEPASKTIDQLDAPTRGAVTNALNQIHHTAKTTAQVIAERTKEIGGVERLPPDERQALLKVIERLENLEKASLPANNSSVNQTHFMSLENQLISITRILHDGALKSRMIDP